MNRLLSIITLLAILLLQASAFCDKEAANEAAVVFKKADGLFLSSQFKKASHFKTFSVEQRKIFPIEIFTVESVRANDSSLEVLVFKPEGLPHLKSHNFRVSLLSSSAVILAEGQGFLHSSSTQESSGMISIKTNIVKNIGGEQIRKIILHSTQYQPAQAIPKSAVLSAISGNFTYVKNGEAFIRTPVTLGISDLNFVEITDGLFEGDEVADGNLEALWISELQAIRGGVGCADE